MKSINKAIALAVVTGASMSMTATAATVDVDNTSFTPGNRLIGIATSQLSQSFEIGLNGILDSVSFQAREDSSSSLGLSFEIRSLVGIDQPSPSDILFSTSLSASAFSSGFQTYEIDVSGASISVSSGDRLAFVISMDAVDNTNGSYGVGAIFTNPYLDGVGLCGSFTNPDAFDYPCGFNGDLWFQTTVDTDVAPVPLPASLPFMVSGLLGTGILAKRRIAA